MREKLINLIQMSIGSCGYRVAEIIADYLLDNGVTILPENAIVLTRSEINALNEHQRKLTYKTSEVRANTVRKMHSEIKKRCITWGVYPVLVARTIDQIAKEMLEGVE